MAASSKSGGAVSFTPEESRLLEWAELVLICNVAPSEVEKLSDMERWVLLDIAATRQRLQAGKPP